MLTHTFRFFSVFVLISFLTMPLNAQEIKYLADNLEELHIFSEKNSEFEKVEPDMAKQHFFCKFGFPLSSGLADPCSSIFSL
jgi:hypothetical protein